MCIKIPHGIHVELESLRLESQCVRSTTPQTYLTLEKKAQSITNPVPTNLQQMFNPSKPKKQQGHFQYKPRQQKANNAHNRRQQKQDPLLWIFFFFLSFFQVSFFLLSFFFFSWVCAFFVICLKSFYSGVCTCFLFVEIECKKLEIYVFLNSRSM